MSWIGTLLRELLVDSNPDKERASMSPRQLYDYLASLRHRTSDQQAQFEYLYKALGRRD